VSRRAGAAEPLGFEFVTPGGVAVTIRSPRSGAITAALGERQDVRAALEHISYGGPVFGEKRWSEDRELVLAWFARLLCDEGATLSAGDACATVREYGRRVLRFRPRSDTADAHPGEADPPPTVTRLADRRR